MSNYLHYQFNEESNEIDISWLVSWVNAAPALTAEGHPCYSRNTWLCDLMKGNAPLSYEEALKAVLDNTGAAAQDDYFWHYDYRFEMRPLNPVVRHAIKQALNIAGIYEDSPNSPHYSEIINNFTHTGYAPSFKEQLLGSDAILKVTAKAYEDRAFYEELSKIGVYPGPFDGACLICAKALQLVFGGHLVRIVSDFDVAQTEHYGVKIGETIFDMGGAYQSATEWVSWFAKEQFVNDRKLSTAVGLDLDSEIINDDRASKLLANYFDKLVFA